MSKARSLFLVWARTTLVLVYLVILAGSVVRATGSGMGCPDWPKCFGHLIPPTQLDQLLFEEGKQFRKGHFIIWQEALWKAKRDLTAGPEINPDDWEKYTRHDYARFNVMHTWTEYVNRLMGALLGFSALIMLALSLRVRHEDPLLPWLSALGVFLIGFEAWLGATVVDSNLEPAKITTHMIGALVIVGVMLTTLRRARTGPDAAPDEAPSGTLPRAAVGLLVAAMAATLVQVILGTQVREHVDTLDKLWNGQMREQWVGQLGTTFQIHRAFAYGVLLVNVAAVDLLRRRFGGWSRVRGVALLLLAVLALEWASGFSLSILGLPAWIQPAHLVIATLVFGLQFRLWSDVCRPAPRTESLPSV